jgi:hypothetical protein
MRGRIHLQALAVSLLSAAFTAHSADIGPQASDIFRPRGFRSGHLGIFPALNYSMTYTDNATRAQDDTSEDYLQEYAPSVEFRFRPQELISMAGFYEFGWHDYAKNEARDYLSHRAAAEIRLQRVFLEGMELSGGSTYLQSGNTGALENNILSFTRYDTGLSFFKAQYQYNRFSISGKYSYGFVNYFSRAESDFDYLTHTGQLEAAYDFIPRRLVAFGNYSLARNLRYTTDLDDFDVHTYLLGARGIYSKLTFSAAAGYSYATLLNETDREEGPSFEARLSYAPHSRITVSLEASRRFQAAVQTGISTETDVKLAVAVAVTPRGKFIADYTRNNSNRLFQVDQLSFAYNAGFEYKLTRLATLNAGFTRTERETDSGTDEYIINEARVGFRLAW